MQVTRISFDRPLREWVKLSLTEPDACCPLPILLNLALEPGSDSWQPQNPSFCLNSKFYLYFSKKKFLKGWYFLEVSHASRYHLPQTQQLPPLGNSNKLVHHIMKQDLVIKSNDSWRTTAWWNLQEIMQIFFFFFPLPRATPTAYGGSQARGRIAVTAAGQCQILNPLSKARNRTFILMDASRILFCWATMGASAFVFFFLKQIPPIYIWNY